MGSKPEAGMEMACGLLTRTGKGKSIEHTIQQTIVELKADTIRTLDRASASGEQSDAAEPATGDDEQGTMPRTTPHKR